MKSVVTYLCRTRAESTIVRCRDFVVSAPAVQSRCAPGRTDVPQWCRHVVLPGSSCCRVRVVDCCVSTSLMTIGRIRSGRSASTRQHGTNCRNSGTVRDVVAIAPRSQECRGGLPVVAARAVAAVMDSSIRRYRKNIDVSMSDRGSASDCASSLR